VVGVRSIVLWRGLYRHVTRQERIASARQLQARTAQASEQLIEKTKGLETSQQEVDRPACKLFQDSVADREGGFLPRKQADTQEAV